MCPPLESRRRKPRLVVAALAVASLFAVTSATAEVEAQQPLPGLHLGGPPGHFQAGFLGYGFGGGWPQYGGYGYADDYYGGYDSFGYGYGPGYDPYYDPYWRGPIYLPPIVIPSESMFGPQAMRRFMGLDTPQSLLPQPAYEPQPPIDAQPGGFGVLAPQHPRNPDRPNVRTSNEAARARSWRFIELGDEAFRMQKWPSAWSSYRKAASAAPDLADGWFRQGFAQVAMRRYPDAVTAFRRGLAMDEDFPQQAFSLDELYGQNALAQEGHWEELAQAAAKQPHDGGLMYLLGVELYFDGQLERAETFLRRAQDLSVDGDDHIRPFLQALKPPAREF